jgi:iron complex outermembrane recepter protein
MSLFPRRCTRVADPAFATTRRTRCLHLWSFLAIALGLVWMTGVDAQSNPPSPVVQPGAAATASSQQDSTGLGEIVVTAQRREESINKVPISITALSQQSMDDLHVVKVEDLSGLVPGVYASPGNPVFQAITIRGIAAGNNAATTEFYIDETPISIRQITQGGNATNPEPLLFDLDRVEVLRGPQGTLFGASAMGGAIRLITPQPSLTEDSGLAKAEAGVTETGDPDFEVGAAYGGPIVSGVAGFRVSAWFQRLGGFVNQENPYSGDIVATNVNADNSYVIRPAVTWSPSEAVSITPSAYLQHKSYDSGDGYWLNTLPNQPGNNDTTGSYNSPVTENLRLGSLAMKFNVGSLLLQSDTSYLDRQITSYTDFSNTIEFLLTDGTKNFPQGSNVIPGLNSFRSYYNDRSFTHAFMQEFRLSSSDPTARVTWVAGAFFRRAVQGVEEPVTGDLTPITEAAYGLTSQQVFGLPNYIWNGETTFAYTDYDATDISEAVFGDMAIAIVPKLKADVGVRLEHALVTQQKEVTAGPLYEIAFSSVVLPEERVNPVTPRFSLTYQFTDNDMAYVSAAKGYRVGGGNSPDTAGNPLCGPSLKQYGLTSVPATYQPDDLWTYEAGLKDLLFNRKLSVRGSIYYTTWKNVQTQLKAASCYSYFTSNEGELTVQGFDLQIEAVIAEGLKIRALAGYTHAYSPETVGGSNGGVPVVAAGEPEQGISPWSAALNGEYSVNANSLWLDSRAYLRLDYRWTGAENPADPGVAGYDPAYNAHLNQAYGVLNARLGIARAGWDLSAYLNNATNADPLLGWGHEMGDSLGTALRMRPRTAGLTAWYRF